MSFRILILFSCSVILACTPSNDYGSRGGVKNDSFINEFTGIYEGVLPCADCEGIQTTLTLNRDETFILNTIYLGKSDELQVEKGDFEFIKDKSGIRLMIHASPSDDYQFLSRKSGLLKLDRGGNEIKGDLSSNYLLEKQASGRARLHGIWELQSINGESVKRQDYQILPVLEFNITEESVVGNDGCNNFMGKIKEVIDTKLIFGPLAGTKKACQRMEVTDQLNENLILVHSYKLDEQTLRLYDEKKEELLSYKKVD